MANKIAFINNKGGSAKTTTAVNVAGAYAKKFPKQKILIIETDGQGNATRSFNLNANDYSKTMYDVFMGNESAKYCIVNAHENIDLIPANNDMNYVEFDEMSRYEDKLNKRIYSILKRFNATDLENMNFNEFVNFVNKNGEDAHLTDSYFNMLDGKLDELEDMYDLIIFDTPPEIKAITSSILSLTDKVIIPYEPDTYSIDGVVNILKRITSIKEDYNPDLHIAGVLAVKVKNRTILHNEVIARMKKYCDLKDINHFNSEIPASIRFASSTSFKGLPATIVMKDNPFVSAYYDLIDELIDKGIL